LDFNVIVAQVQEMNVQLVNAMTANPVTVSSRDTLAKAKALMDAGRFRRLPVVDDGRLIGIVTERDLRGHSGTLDYTRVDAAMRSAVVTVSASDSVEDAARLMLKHKVGGLPVVEGGKLVGIVTMTDIVKGFLRLVEATGQIMND
jgi:acetoin utilization protein AcuB